MNVSTEDKEAIELIARNLGMEIPSFIELEFILVDSEYAKIDRNIANDWLIGNLWIEKRRLLKRLLTNERLGQIEKMAYCFYFQTKEQKSRFL